MQIRIIPILTSIALFLGGCTSYDYSRQIVQQGTMLSNSQLQRLKVGMSKDDVAILLGTSLIGPMFNNNRWDYAYTWQKQGKIKCIKSVSIFFADYHMTRMEKTDRCIEEGHEHGPDVSNKN